MRLYLSTSMLVLIYAMIACTPAGNPPQTPIKSNPVEDSKAISRLRDEFAAAWKAGDAERVANAYTNDAVLLPQNGPAVTGKSAILAFDKGFFDQYAPSNFEISSDEVQTMGDWAFDRGTYKFMATPKAGGEPLNDQGKYIVLLQRQADGSWKLARDIDNSSAPRAQAAPASKPKS
jgi:uncharacterized protein (TIGR02246 family)